MSFKMLALRSYKELAARIVDNKEQLLQGEMVQKLKMKIGVSAGVCRGHSEPFLSTSGDLIYCPYHTREQLFVFIQHPL